jgi:hypothetical protein
VVFLLAAVILHRWLRFHVNPAKAKATAASLATGRVPPLTRRDLQPVHSGPHLADRDRHATALSPRLPKNKSPHGDSLRLNENCLQVEPVFEVKESGSPRLGLPIVPGAAVLLEAWPGIDGPEEFVPSIQPFARPTPLETGDAKPPR